MLRASRHVDIVHTFKAYFRAFLTIRARHSVMSVCLSTQVDSTQRVKGFQRGSLTGAGYLCSQV